MAHKTQVYFLFVASVRRSVGCGSGTHGRHPHSGTRGDSQPLSGALPVTAAGERETVSLHLEGTQHNVSIWSTKAGHMTKPTVQEAGTYVPLCLTQTENGHVCEQKYYQPQIQMTKARFLNR